MSKRTYLDHNASAPVRPEVRTVVAELMEKHGNPSSVHSEGRQLRGRIEKAREQVAALVGADPRNVIFTSGGTEANTTALAPENAGSSGTKDVVCFVSDVEHPSVLAGGRFDANIIRRVPVTETGVADIATLESMIVQHHERHADAPFMVSLMRANNETGALQPVSEISGFVKEHGGTMHCDAIQAAGKVPVDISDLGVQMLSLSAHKIGGPQGVGALVLGSGMSSLAKPLVIGGGQEFRARSGTENVAGIAGFGEAAEIAQRELGQVSKLAVMRDRLEENIRACAPEVSVFGAGTQRLPNTCCFATSGMKSETIVIALDLAGVAVSAGSSCSSGKVEKSHVLEAMGVDDDLARGAIRVSLGWNTTQDDIDKFVAAWSGIYDQFSKEAAAA